MITLVAIWAVTSAGLGLVLQLELLRLDARRHASDGDVTIDQFDGLGLVTVDVYREPDHTCPTCLRTCRAVLQLEAYGTATRWFYCGHCAPAMLRPEGIDR